ncbi:hypothetical protein DSM106972_077380 [Dulcicalothrix desertica PCC 7102]|uniref:Uncharacterized protein n=1 Tax=Dulcicalothrix desertica PCC 7102 TaxID=232991 RepID=A0A3S1CAF4_9CYAN|nr:hypothetical protein [Dulcicalothrix desertica]RUS99296.1 hypothetical protein DSM106972_077380 [Dulcicalothrix desertica PCC 7102]TWH49962.1 hypothetical protein CAL7102_04234 [Dulcicalothrix desertica PCC 7102]
MTQTSDKHELTPEELAKWRELNELGLTAIAGTPFSEEEYDARLQSVIDGSCFEKYLNKILRRKEETLKKLAALEETEQMLKKTIAEIKDASKS